MAIITVAEAKTHLNETTAANDAELATFVAAADAFVEALVGKVTEVEVTEVVHPDADGFAWLDHPVITLTSLTEVYGGSDSWVAADVTTASPELAKGKVWLGTSYSTTAYPVKVVYQAGRSSVPALIKSACLDYLKWDWLSQRGASPTPFTTADEFSFVPGTTPHKIREKLAPYTRAAGVA